jgi:hypothetical protein
MTKRPNFADSLRESGGSIRAVPTAVPAEAVVSSPADPKPRRQAVTSSRRGTKPITVHFAPGVRYQLKLLAAEKDRTMEDMVAEALNDLFAKHGKPEIAPVAARSAA